MKNSFIQIAASADHAVAYTIGLILKHNIDCVQLYFTNSFTNIVLACRRDTYLWRQTTNNSSNRSSEVASSAGDNAIFKNEIRTRWKKTLDGGPCSSISIERTTLRFNHVRFFSCKLFLSVARFLFCGSISYKSRSRRSLVGSVLAY